MVSNNVHLHSQLMFWDDELARAVADLHHAEKYDDRGAIEWHEERVRWAKMKINDIRDSMGSKKGA
ncbi:hypothetical protein [Paenibacillus polysaccharolyticus]|uniref:hypothetical protein n=1 Tax=Paenibacillus polysaccharolyticus TaxID=582692 RepID=UPI00300B8234